MKQFSSYKSAPPDANGKDEYELPADDCCRRWRATSSHGGRTLLVGVVGGAADS